MRLPDLDEVVHAFMVLFVALMLTGIIAMFAKDIWKAAFR